MFQIDHRGYKKVIINKSSESYKELIVCVVNCWKHWIYLIFYIYMFTRNPLKPQDFIIFDPMYVDQYTIFDIHFVAL